MEAIIVKLNEIFKEVLDNQSIALTAATTANDIEEWDSLNHIHLVVEIENHFNISFTAAEMQSWKKIGDLAAHIAHKMKA
jgi:acyl carrier protein